MPTVKKSSTYIESPLGIAIARVLDQINAVEKDMASTCDNSQETAEILYTADMLSEVKSILNLLHKKILPKFDHEKIPSLKKDLLSPKLLFKIASIAKNQEKFLSKEVRICNNLFEQLPHIIKEEMKKLNSKIVTEEIFENIKQAMKIRLKDCTTIKVKGKILEIDPHKKISKIFENMIESFQYSQFTKIKNHEENLKKTAIDATESILKDLLNKALENYFAETKLSPITIYIIHETTFQLLMMILEIYAELPEKIQEIVPFFNPDFIYGKLSRVMNKAFNKTISITPVENTKPNEFIFHLKSPTIEDTIDANEEYQNSKKKLLLKNWYQNI